MKNSNNRKYDRRLESLDWRYSAAIIGLIEYFDFYNIEYEALDEEDYILYSEKEITEERYLKFVEYKYNKEFYHIEIENILNK